MNASTFKKFAAWIVASLLAGTQFANATVVQYTVNTAAQSQDFSSTITVPQFDLSLGTLQKIDIQLSSNVDTVFTIKNNTLHPITGTFSASTDSILTDPGLHFSNEVYAPSALASFTNVAVGTTFDSGHQVVTINFPTATYTSAANSDVLDEFSSNGPGNLMLGFQSAQDPTLPSGVGNSPSTHAATASSALTVSYTFDPIAHAPEPGSTAALLALFGTSFFAKWLRRGKSRE